MRSETLSDWKMQKDSVPPSCATLVIGYGNDLRSDDGAGIRAATMIAAQLPQARVIISHQLTPDLAVDIATADQVVFVDAYAAHKAGAKLRIAKIPGDAAGSASALLAHHCDPANLVGLAGRLFGRVPDAWVMGIPAYCFDTGENISPETSRRIDEAVALFGESAFFGTWKGEPT